jgi:hypothetical protein
MDYWNMDESHLVSDNNCNPGNLLSLQILQGMANNVGLTFGVGHTTPQFSFNIEQDN